MQSGLSIGAARERSRSTRRRLTRKQSGDKEDRDAENETEKGPVATAKTKASKQVTTQAKKNKVAKAAAKVAFALCIGAIISFRMAHDAPLVSQQLQDLLRL